MDLDDYADAADQRRKEDRERTTLPPEVEALQLFLSALHMRIDSYLGFANGEEKIRLAISRDDRVIWRGNKLP